MAHTGFSQYRAAVERHARHWMRVLGLERYALRVRTVPTTKDNEDAYATVNIWPDRLQIIVAVPESALKALAGARKGNTLPVESPSGVALHEILHALLADVGFESRWVELKGAILATNNAALAAVATRCGDGIEDVIERLTVIIGELDERGRHAKSHRPV